MGWGRGASALPAAMGGVGGHRRGQQRSIELRLSASEFLAALKLAHDQQTFGSEYVQAILAQPAVRRSPASADLASQLPAMLQVPQIAVERALIQYEQYVANRVLVSAGVQ